MNSLELLKKHLNDMQHELDSDGRITSLEIKALLAAAWGAIEDVEIELATAKLTGADAQLVYLQIVK